MYNQSGGPVTPEPELGSSAASEGSKLFPGQPSIDQLERLNGLVVRSLGKGAHMIRASQYGTSARAGEAGRAHHVSGTDDSRERQPAAAPSEAGDLVPLDSPYMQRLPAELVLPRPF